MKRLLTVLLMAVLILTGCSGSGKKEEAPAEPKDLKTYKVALDLENEENVLFAKYDIEVFIC